MDKLMDRWMDDCNYCNSTSSIVSICCRISGRGVIYYIHYYPMKIEVVCNSFSIVQLYQYSNFSSSYKALGVYFILE